MTDTIRVGEGVTGWTVEFTPTGTHWLDFTGWEIVALEGDSDIPLYGQDNQFETDRTKVTPDVKGSIKWDGCSQWDWPTGAWHLCGVGSALERVALFKAVFDYAAKHYEASCMSDELQWPQ